MSKSKLKLSFVFLAIGLVVSSCPWEASSKKASPKATGWIISTKAGRVQGSIGTSRDGRLFHQWLGVPYAEAPVGDLRFESPQPYRGHGGVRDAMEYPPVCTQVNKKTMNLIGQEDCLYLNIYSPRITGKNHRLMTYSSLPVMVFIHGGLFQANSGSVFQPEYFMDEDVVLVTINYRLGVLGFLNTGDGLIHGNMGLKDQSLALKWVYDNIRSFGGDPRKITVFGQSAGAVSSHMHMLSPLSQPYINKVISQSGTAVSKSWAYYKHPKKQADWFLSHVNCTSNTTQEEAAAFAVECLKAKTTSELYSFWKSTSITNSGSTWTKKHLFVPTIEVGDGPDAFLTKDPQTLLESGDFKAVPWLTGTTSGDGLYLAARYFRELKERAAFIHYWNITSDLLLALTPEERKQTAQIRDYYFPNGTANVQAPETFEAIRDLLSDHLFFFDQQEALKYHNARLPNSAFPYLYDNQGEYSLFDVVKPEKFYGSFHGDEMFMLTPFKTMSVGVDQQDYAFSKEMVSLWVQFASDEPEFGIRDQKLEAFKPEDEFSCYQLKYQNCGPIKAPFQERYRWWKAFQESAKSEPESTTQEATVSVTV